MTSSRRGRGPNRRRVLQGGAALVAGLRAGPLASGQVAAEGVLAPSDPHAWLLKRASFGITTRSLGEVHSRGLEGWVDWQLQPELIDDSAAEGRLLAFDWLSNSAEEMRTHPTLATWQIAREHQAARLVRATYSSRQLFERVVEFWTDHFNIFGFSSDTHVTKVVDDRGVIRAHALGPFRELLHASAKSPAMLAYLNNDTNVVGAAQENYAREVMELHTLGSDGPYTESDVRELARCFTGWSYRQASDPGGAFGTFVFHAADHDAQPKTLLGLQIPAGGGLTDAEAVLDLLADHPKTVDYVTTKLARWFLGSEPPVRVLEAAKAAWVQSGGEIREVVRSLLSPDSLRRAAPWRAPKLKRPFHWSVSMYRAVGVDITNPESTISQLSDHGDLPFAWGPPDGYPDTAAAWASGLITRWRDGMRFSNGWYWSIAITPADLRPLLAGAPKEDWGQTLSRLLCAGTMSALDQRAVQAHADSFPADTDEALGEAFEIAIASPSFQTY